MENKLNFVGYFEKNSLVLLELDTLLQACINLDITIYTTINKRCISVDINIFSFSAAELATFAKALDVCPTLKEKLKQRE